MRQTTLAAGLVLASGLLTACGGGNALTGINEGITRDPVSRFDLAHGCYRLRINESYVARDGNQLVANGNAETAERFYMQPANLGRYLFYTADQRLMTASGSTVSTTVAPADGSDWTVDGDGGRFSATTLGASLAAGDDGRLQLADPAGLLRFEPAQGCSVYPEMPVGVRGPVFKGPPVGQPVIGFAEVHSHMGMASELSDGSGDVGPSAGGVLYGQAVNRFGAPAALDNCQVLHGPDGRLSAENIILDGDPLASHDTQGWPSFVDWPARDSFLHQQMYYRWIERAYRAGLRVMVNHGTTIEALCNIAKATYGDKTAECVDMDTGVMQVEYLYVIQDYVDAQAGGPGQGWFRIVKDPTEARQVIADGKLAVIPGLEFSNIFYCRVRFLPDGSEISGCTREIIDAEIDRAWELGVRQVFPYHDVDSALGGTGIFSSVLNYVGFTDTLGFWKTYACPDGGDGPSYFYNAGAVLETAAVTQFVPALADLLTSLTGGALPVYGPGRQCNARPVTDLGQYAIDKMMKKGFVIDIDHASLIGKQYMLDQSARTSPAYPLVSGHGAQGGLTTAQAVQLLRQGGIIYPILPNGRDWADFQQRLKPIWDAAGRPRPMAIGYGADTNGLRTLPGPRGAGSEPIRYPFTLFQGPGWGPQYAAAGIAPVTVDMLAIPGGKVWNMDEQGMAHYGLVADIVEEIRIEAGVEGTDALYRSAEDYLQMWEQTLRAAESARALPSP
jgi:hypothetical protein